MREQGAEVRALVVASDRLARSALVGVVQDVMRVLDAVAPRDDIGALAVRLGADVVVWDLNQDAPPDALGKVGLPVIALTEHVEIARRAVAMGAAAVLDRDGDAERLAAVVQAVMLDLTVIDARLREPSDAPTAAPDEPLTAREGEVLGLLAEGLSDRGIAERLGVSAHTAKFHVQALRSKLGASSRTEAVVLAVRAGLLRL